MNNRKVLAVSLLAVCSVASWQYPSLAQDNGGTVYRRTTTIESTNSSTPATSDTSSSETTTEQRGVMGVKSANAFVPKYKERLNTYADQIQLGLTRGWLTQEQATHFGTKLERLRKLDAEVAAKNYAQPELDNLEKQMTQFNIEFTSKPAATSAKPAVPAPVQAAAPKPTAAKPAAPAKPAAKSAPKRK